MMEAGLPKTFDVVVIGTGITESIVSAAASRNGHSVLHLDPREFYGSSTATLNWDSWMAQEFATLPPTIAQTEFTSGNKLEWKDCCRNVEQVWYDSSDDVKEEFDKNKRRFNIDVFPQVILAREEIIELLIKSDVSRYLEFLRVGKMFTNLPEDTPLVSIPLSRSDIFTSKSVELWEKRCLVRFIEAVMKTSQQPENLQGESSNEEPPNPQDYDTSNCRTFDDLTNACLLTPRVTHLVRCVVQEMEDTEEKFQTEFIPRCVKYLQSIGRFGNQTPYLWPLYGVSEICQGFCRLSAVYGSIFILKRFITSIEEQPEGAIKITSENDQFETKHLVIGPEFRYLTNNPTSSSSFDENKINDKPKTVGRGVIVTRGNNLKVETDFTNRDGICLYKLGKLHVVELSSHSQAVPKNYRLLQITFPVDDEYPRSLSVSPQQYIESRLKYYVNFGSMLTSSDTDDDDYETDEAKAAKPQAVYGSYFWVDLWNSQPSSPTSQIHNCAVNSIDLTSQINRATNIFESMFPGEEFLPKPPPIEPNDEDSSDIIDINNLPNHFDVPPKSSDGDEQQHQPVRAD